MKQNDKPLFPEPVFPEGIYYNLPHENAPNFVKGTLSINVEKMKIFLEQIIRVYYQSKLKNEKFNDDRKSRFILDSVIKIPI